MGTGPSPPPQWFGGLRWFGALRWFGDPPWSTAPRLSGAARYPGATTPWVHLAWFGDQARALLRPLVWSGARPWVLQRVRSPMPETTSNNCRVNTKERRIFL